MQLALRCAVTHFCQPLDMLRSARLIAQHRPHRPLQQPQAGQDAARRN